ncbi:MAG: ABC transporter permease [Acholeplasmataceae bacterium]|nr:ABC transporter permease [Acholeplasmataceae bacterium]
MKLALQIAWRFLSSAKRQTFIIILGIAVGVSVQVFIGSLITGLQKSLVDTTIGSSSHITVLAADDTSFVDDYMTVVDDLESESNQIEVLSPVVNIGGILQKGTDKNEILFRGFDLDLANEIYGFDSKITEGNLPTQLNDILLGLSLKDELDLNVGDSIEIEILGNIRTLNVVGFFDFNVSVINSTWGIGTLATLQDIIGNTNQVSAIEMQIKDVFEAENLALILDTNLSSSGLVTENWMAQNQSLLSGLQGQSTSSLMIQVFVIISVVLGISSVLAITVMQKSKQIGILKAMGILDQDASKVFLFEGFILGIFGAIGGVLLGLGLTFSFTTFALNPDGTPVVPLFIDPGFILLSAGIALVASTLASLIPAIKSSKMTVIEVIRNA